ncbi:MAG: tRNA (N6-isopentenyl adenosine(37)-C2)-methylthiotransferase MiaB [Clostridiaceae bacterium]|nr:tRNA (N6-isopentenyl adenosine(37)-C2)-methylthiotransferase MiaB [Eubacteriales bacterium]
MLRKTAVPDEELEKGRQAALRLHDDISFRGLSYFIESYGCQMNDHDAEKLAGMLHACGYRRAEEKLKADLILFNTCCVREHAELRVFGNIGALKKRKEENPSLIVGVCGCMMQQKDVAEKLFKRFPFVDLVFGTHELHRFPALLESALNGERTLSVTQSDGEIAEGLPVERSGRFQTNVTIMYGCDNFCSYCIVPYVRGRERSRDSADILGEIKALAEAGFKEITLLGQNVNSYRGDGGQTSFARLLRMANSVEGIERLRFMTSHPKDLSMELIQTMADCKKVCNHIHLPVQSGSDRVLKRMNRGYTREKYLSLVKALRESVEGMELTTDIIVGFPGETEEDFLDTLSLVREAGFSAAYTFMYSPRNGTSAARMDEQVDKAVKKGRLERLNRLQAELLRQNNERYVGKSGTVLVEGCDRRTTPMAYGKLTSFKMVYFPGDETLEGQLKRVRITKTQSNSLLGELIEG